MPWKYNPFTDALDQTGSGGGTSYIDGDVEYHSNLPVTVGTPAVNSAFLVRKGEGLYFVSRKPAGIWVRELNNGNLDDWKYAGTFSDLYRDANFRILNNTDITKELAFDVSGIATGTTRTLTVPNASGRIQVEGQPIGNTTPNTGAFTTLTANNGTLTAAEPALTVAQTWNNGSIQFRTLNIDITNTASATESYFLQCRTGTTVRAYIRADGRIVAGANVYGGTGLESALLPQGVAVGSAAFLGLCSNTFANESGCDTRLFRDAADTLAQRRTTNPKTFRLYNTFTSATNFERLNVRWASNELIIDAEAGSAGGTLRGIKIGSATSSLLGFYGVTPVDQPATVTDPTGGGTQDAEARTAINTIIDRLQELGLIA